jgi:dihydrofolate reductase
MRISAIVAMAERRVIGSDGTMPWHVLDDLKHFKKTTLGKPIIMGRRTFHSIGKPLPGRTNIVLSRDVSFAAKGIVTVRDKESALDAAKHAAGGDDEIMIVGGAKIYALFMEIIERVYLTKIHAAPDGDTFFPTLDAAEWIESHREDHSGDPSYSFITLDRSPN